MSSEIGVETGNDDLVIDACGVGKCYQIYERPSHRLLQGLFGDSRRFYREFWALRGISLQVRRGETLGIIGKNGSGKSTLLQMIAGTLAPTEGQVAIQGRIAALLELGSGFNPDFTGRENVHLNASILGLTSAQIDARMQQILDFADIGAFIDQPIRNYSSGMVMRLAFSVMAHVDADVLIIDEALAVGDAFFTQKCMRFLREFKARGTLLFVSHDDAAVTGLCDKALWIDGGKTMAYGESRDVVQQYLESVISSRQGEASMRTAGGEGAVEVRQRHDMRRDLVNASNLRNDIEVRAFDPEVQGFGEMRARISEVTLRDDQGRDLSWCVGGESVVLDIDFVADGQLERPIVGFYVKDRLGQLLFGDNTYVSTLGREAGFAEGTRARARFEFEMPRLKAGDYFITVGIADGSKDEHVIQHWVHEALALKSLCQSWSIGILGLPMSRIALEVLE
ncbi:ABC transporter ATP-binding protein [Luteimonas terrae]|uniref:Lipopolysaccharide transport system ATP-binding protein n=1 Tax=Luteimonas terrae TaxID=1530191 RepID=A0ABU1XZE5_9GAMM|nr:ABC transporter ATP-binding protein [Luteimonas terrae]MDR7194159.1 lipopolysaccharide transport system ATP-binding protein [Luteimonas terrae]